MKISEWSLEPAAQETFVAISKFRKEGKGGIKLFAIEELWRWRKVLLQSKDLELDTFADRYNESVLKVNEYYSENNFLDSKAYSEAKSAMRDEYDMMRFKKMIEYNRVIEGIDIRIRKLEIYSETH